MKRTGSAHLLRVWGGAPTRDGWREPKLARFQVRPRGESAGVARWATRGLGVDPKGPLTTLGDGAAWTWTAATEHFPAGEQVLDIFHASEHLAATATATAAAAEWLDLARGRLLADGWPGLLDHIGDTPTEGRTAAGQAALDGTIAYFAKHTERVGHCGRLHTGRSIGSGAIEGLAKRLGRRLKVAGRGWCGKQLDGMAAPIATVDISEWSGLWVKPAA